MLRPTLMTVAVRLPPRTKRSMDDQTDARHLTLLLKSPTIAHRVASAKMAI